MEKTTEILSNEHQNILKVISSLTKEADCLANGQPIDKGFFSQVVDFIRNYADKFHHAKEEDILFVELCKDTVEMHCNPVEQMLYEHDQGRNFVKGIEEGMETEDKDKIIENTRGYAYLLQDHIFKEDNILYSMADQVLDQKTQESMLVKFKEAEDIKFNQAFYQKYLNIIQEFESRHK